MKEVVRIAMMVPKGMDLWASRRSPDLLEPAIIPKRKKQSKQLRDTKGWLQPNRSHALSRFLNYNLGQIRFYVATLGLAWNNISTATVRPIPVTEGK